MAKIDKIRTQIASKADVELVVEGIEDKIRKIESELLDIYIDGLETMAREYARSESFNDSEHLKARFNNTTFVYLETSHLNNMFTKYGLEDQIRGKVYLDFQILFNKKIYEIALNYALDEFSKLDSR